MARISRPEVELLVLSDLHLRPTGAEFPTDELPVEEHNLVLSLGDVIDENREHAKSPSAGEAYEERGRAFFEALDACGVPVLAVPGNHDPLACTRRLTEGLENVHPLHGETVRVASDGDWSLTIAGWGCEQFDFTPALLSPDYPDLPIEGSVRTPDTIAEALLQAAGQYLARNLTEQALAEQLGTLATSPEFEDSLRVLEDRFEALVDLVGPTDASPVLVASHVSPFGVPFDVRSKHSHDGNHHFGSVALRLALAASGPAGCLSGHTHQRGFTAVETTNGHTYAHNPGEGGVTSVHIAQDGTLTAEPLDFD